MIAGGLAVTAHRALVPDLIVSIIYALDHRLSVAILAMFWRKTIN